ncbi:MAG TPA: glycosyltransferase family 39 protein [Bacteroidota bacterium]|nr:glycosyltransferase family 39 protein [Bacteroidota bacterium]
MEAPVVAVGRLEYSSIRKRGLLANNGDTASPVFHCTLLIILGLLCNLYGLLHASTVIQGWDGTDLGSIARNFYRNGFHFLYPQVDWGGNGPGYVEMQFPLTPFFVAVLYKVFGFHEELAIVVPLLSGIGTIVAVYYLARHEYDASVGLMAGLFVAISPYWSWQSTILVNDPTMILCGTAGMYMFLRWVEEERWVHYILAIVLVSLAILLKMTALYLGIPLMYLWLAKCRSLVWKDARFWLFGLAVLAGPGIWYYHAHLLYVRYGNTFGIIFGGSSKFGSKELLLSPGFYTLVGSRMMRYVFTPLVSLFVILGCIMWEKKVNANLFRVWTLGVLLYEIVAAKGAYYGIQYLMPILPPGAVVASAAAYTVLRNAGQSGPLRKLAGIRFGPAVAPALVALLVVSSGIWYMRILQYMEGLDHVRREIGQTVAQVTKPGSLIIVCNTTDDEFSARSPDQLSRSPQIFYYSDRKGWYSSMRWFDETFLEARRAEGASCVVIPIEVNDFIARHPMYKYLSTHYPEIVHTEKVLIYGLESTM